MKVLFFLPYCEQAPGCRYRVYQYLPYLRAQGVECEVRELVTPDLYKILYKTGHRLTKAALFAGRTMARLKSLVEASDHDVLFVYRECFPFGPALMEGYLARLGKPIVYDFDDAIYLPDPNPLKNVLRYRGKTTSIVHLADEVIVSNRHLAGLCAAFNRNVSIIPTSVDTERKFVPRDYPAQLPPADGRPVRLGWIGSHSTVKYLERLAGVLARVAARHPVELLVTGAGREVHFPGVKVIQKPWSLQTEVADFRSLDIGLYPMVDDLWELGKACFKQVQYMAVGVPGVLSPVGMALDIVRDGHDCLFARDDDQWVAQISRLIEQPDLRRRIGQEGRRTAMRSFSIKENAPRLLEVLRRAARGGTQSAEAQAQAPDRPSNGIEPEADLPAGGASNRQAERGGEGAGAETLRPVRAQAPG